MPLLLFPTRLLTLATVSCAVGLAIVEASPGHGFLALPVIMADGPRAAKRSSDVWTELVNQDFFYATRITLGNPPQTITVLVDTGSSELWVNPDCGTAPTPDRARQCAAFGRYRPKDSQTPPAGPFGSERLVYGDPSDSSTQTTVELVYYADDLSWPNSSATIANQTFGVATSSQGVSQGILGLAPDVRVGFDEGQPYSLLLNSIAAQGVIASRVFTLDLRHAESHTGALIYGGLDRNRFIGQLQPVPFVASIQGEARLAVKLESLGTTLNGSADTHVLEQADQPVTLDSGSTLTRLFSGAASPILEALGAEPVGDSGVYATRCGYRDEPGSVNFGFGGGKTIRVPLRDFILDVGDPARCYVGLVKTEAQQTLGESVLRAGYFVFDWDNRQVHIAQAATCGDVADLVVVGSGHDAVPKVTGHCRDADASVTAGLAGAPTDSAAGSGGREDARRARRRMAAAMGALVALLNLP